MQGQSFNPRDDSAEQAQEAGYQPELVTVKALISPGIKDQFIERYGQKSVECYSPELFMATFLVPHASVGFDFLAGFGTRLQIVEPESYVEAFRNYILEIVKKYH
ncbi:hypothetical protein D3C80_1640390 [compost metagenome]